MQENVKKPNKRHQSRVHAMQALYQWQFTAQNAHSLTEEFFEDHPLASKDVDIDYFQILVSGVLEQMDAIDAVITPSLDRKMSLLNPVELAILRLATFELMHRKEVPDAVVLNEAIEIAKEYGAEDGYKYVNGVLNSMLPKVRG